MDGSSTHNKPAPSGVQIRTYVVLDAGGRILAVKLNRTSAVATQRVNHGSTIDPHMADKRSP
jgi:hypothetical protein